MEDWQDWCARLLTFLKTPFAWASGLCDLTSQFPAQAGRLLLFLVNSMALNQVKTLSSQGIKVPLWKRGI
jgi:hypothetical protein